MKKCLTTMMICFLGTQIAGLVFGTTYFMIELYDPYTADLEIIKAIPVFFLMGTFFTIIPSIIYAVIISCFILKNHQKERSWWVDYGISVSLVTIVYYIALFIVHGSRAMDMLFYPIIIPALLAGIIGIATTHRYLNRNKQNMHNQGMEPTSANAQSVVPKD